MPKEAGCWSGGSWCPSHPSFPAGCCSSRARYADFISAPTGLDAGSLLFVGTADKSITMKPFPQAACPCGNDPNFAVQLPGACTASRHSEWDREQLSLRPSTAIILQRQRLISFDTKDSGSPMGSRVPPASTGRQEGG